MQRPGVKRGARARVLQLPLTAGAGISADVADAISRQFVAAVAERLGEPVISSGDVEVALGVERSRQLLGCSDGSSSCLVELGGAMGTEWVVTGSVSRLGDTLLFEASVLDQRRALVPRRFSRRLANGKPEQLVELVEPAAAALFPREGAVESAVPAPVAPPEPPPTGRSFGLQVALGSGPTASRDDSALRLGAVSFVRFDLRPLEFLQVGLGATLAGGTRPGGVLRVAATPWASSTIHPRFAAEGLRFFDLSDGQGPFGLRVGAGAEWVPLPWLGFGLELGFLRLTGDATQQLVNFGTATGELQLRF